MSFANGPFSAEMPLGLSFGLAMEQERIKEEEKLTEYEKEKLIAESKSEKNKEEMKILKQRIEEEENLKIEDHIENN